MPRAAFSLVELSIVLVILGLLTGGILAGQSLIRASELRAVSTEMGRFATARLAFRDKYFAEAGDMRNAFAFWGAACGTNTSTLNVGCNGNGDGTIGYIDGENLKAWEHLAFAGLVEGSYDGTGADTGAGLEPSAADLPRSKLPNSYWDLTSNPSNIASQPAGVFHTLTLGNLPTAGNANLAAIPGLLHEEAWNIDTKMDDGSANAGKMRGDGNGDCQDDGTNYYSIPGGGDCALYFLI